MKRTFPFLLMMLALLVVAACGTAEPAVTEAFPTPAAPVETATAGSGTPIEITLADNSIDAAQTEFQVGVTYTFVITNTGQHAHNFNINPPVSITGSLEEALNSALLVVPQEQLGPGATAMVDFTFPPDTAGQLLEFSCLIRRHYDDGMRVDIIGSN
jgi:uncharacterized cupredoxin-like copper-binding protein